MKAQTNRHGLGNKSKYRETKRINNINWILCDRLNAFNTNTTNENKMLSYYVNIQLWGNSFKA